MVSPPAQAMEISLFPLMSCEKATSGSLEWEVNFVYPLFHAASSGDLKEANIPILFSYEKSARLRTVFFDLLWPIFTYHKRPRGEGEGFRSELTLVPFFSRSFKESPDGNYKKYSLFPIFFIGSDQDRHPFYILFPFFWYADQARVFYPFPSQNPQTFFAILPFFGVFHNLAGNDLIKTWLWPLVVYAEHEGRQKYYFLWPFLGYGTGEGYKAYRFWPLFTWAEFPDGSTRLNYLWPLGYHRRQMLKGGERAALDMFLPLYIRFRSPKERWDYFLLFYGMRDTPLRHQWSLLWPLFRITNFTQTQMQRITLLLLFDYQNGEKDYILQLFPLFGKREKPDKARSFILWPFYQYKYDDYISHKFTRHYFFPFYMRRQWEYPEGIREIRTVVFPFYAKRVVSDGSWSTSALRIFYYDKAKNMDRNWGRLFPFYKSEGRLDERTTTRIFWKLYHREQAGDYDKREVNTILFQWKRENEAKEYNLLGGLVGLKKKPEKTLWKFFFIPLGKDG